MNKIDPINFIRRKFPRLRALLFEMKVFFLTSIYKQRNVGRGSYIDPSVHVLGWGSVRVGENTVLSQDCWLNVNVRYPPRRQIVIGDNCYIGRRNFFSSGRLISLGDYCLTGTDCKFLGAGHVYSDPFRPYVTTGATQGAVINVGVNSWLGASVTILGSVKIGHGSIIGATSLVNRDLPPFSVAVGNPARVIKRYDILSGQWMGAETFTAEQEALLPNEVDYLATLHRNMPIFKKDVWSAGRSRGDLP